MSDNDGGLPVISSSSLADQAHVLIRERILNGDLAGGTALKDSVLASQLGVSRAPVRQALERLLVSGLVSKSANRPYKVVDIDAAALSELQLMRFADESAAIIHHVANGTDLSSLTSCLQAMADLVDVGSGWAAIVDADLRFHRELVALTGLPRLLARYESILDQVRTFLNGFDVPTAWVESIVTRHTQMLDSLTSCQIRRDARPAIAFWEAHIIGDHREQI